jgi:toxin-antitoxin system PIN domain toxin
MLFLTDINVLLALVYGDNEYHHQAKQWLKGVANDSVIVCRVTQNGLLRLLTLAAVMRDDVLTMSQAWQLYDQLMADERFTFVHEPDGIEEVWRALCPSNAVSPKKWMDAYLAALAIALGAQLVTFDRGFREFRGLNLHLIGQVALHEERALYALQTGT